MYTRVVRLQIHGRNLSLESSFNHIFIQVQKNEWEPYIDPRVIIPPIPVSGPIRVCPRMVILRGVTVPIVLFSMNCANILLSLWYILSYSKEENKKEEKKKKKIKTPSFDASSLLYDHSSPHERTTNTPRHDPYQPTRNESQDKNRSRGASSYRSRPRFVFTTIPMR